MKVRFTDGTPFAASVWTALSALDARLRQRYCFGRETWTIITVRHTDRPRCLHFFLTSRKRQRRHYDQHNAGSGVSVLEREEKRNISRREAGKCTLEALKPSQMEVLLTLNLDGE